jgi:hypothetical protein
MNEVRGTMRQELLFLARDLSIAKRLQMPARPLPDQACAFTLAAPRQSLSERETLNVRH